MSYHAVDIWSDDYVVHVSLLQDCDEAHTKWKQTRLCLIRTKGFKFRKVYGVRLGSGVWKKLTVSSVLPSNRSYHLLTSSARTLPSIL